MYTNFNENSVYCTSVNSKTPTANPTANTMQNVQIYLKMVWLDASYKIRVTPVTGINGWIYKHEFDDSYLQ